MPIENDIEIVRDTLNATAPVSYQPGALAAFERIISHMTELQADLWDYKEGVMQP